MLHQTAIRAPLSRDANSKHEQTDRKSGQGSEYNREFRLSPGGHVLPGGRVRSSYADALLGRLSCRIQVSINDLRLE